MSAPMPPDQPQEPQWGPQQPQWASQQPQWSPQQSQWGSPQMAGPPLAGWWSRVGAALLDGLIGIGFLILPAIIIAVLVSGGSDDSNTTFDAARGVDSLLYIVFVLIYYPLTMKRAGAHNGQTWG